MQVGASGATMAKVLAIINVDKNTVDSMLKPLKGVPGEACACGVGLLLHATAVRGAAVMHAAAWWQGGVGGSGAGSVAPGSW